MNMQPKQTSCSTDYKRHSTYYSRGATLLDAVVSTALMLVVFMGIYGAFQLSIDVVTNNKSRAGAIALANERQEYIRSLNYDAVGTLGGIPSGTFPQVEVAPLNGISYTRSTTILYEDDPADGSGALDSNAIVTDYKLSTVEVSWVTRNGITRTITLTTRISPIGIEQSVPGGTLDLSILDSNTQPVAGAAVRIVNTTLVPAIDTTLDSNVGGKVTVYGAPPGAGYQITVTKSGYSSAQTYDATAINTNPTPGHLTVALNSTTAAPFSIDLVSTKNIRSFTPSDMLSWSDSFLNTSLVAALNDTEVSGGDVILGGGAGSYAPSGEVRSLPVTPTSVKEWGAFSWSDTRPAQTGVLYRVYDGTTPLSDAALPGNSTGFSTSPINLSSISTTTYATLSLHATLSSSDVNATPSVHSWSVTYDTGPQPLSNITFGLQGTKTIGNGPGGLIYKYSTSTLSTGATAGINVPNLEWDTYTLSVDAATGYDIASSCNPQPESLVPGAYAQTQIILEPHTTNSLLVNVRSSAGTLLLGASVRLYRSPGYDTTRAADDCGQGFFSGLSAGTPGGGNPYSIDVSAAGYTTYSATDVSVSGTSYLSIVLN